MPRRRPLLGSPVVVASVILEVREGIPVQRRWRLACLILLLAFTAAPLVAIFGNPAARSPDAIRTDLLRLAPLGTELAKVETMIRAKGWDKGKCWSEYPDGKRSRVMVQYGRFLRPQYPLWPGTVEAHWHFDRDGLLTDVSVHRFPE